MNLPMVNENGYYEIRLESIGGLGANLCGKMLGELGAVYMGLNSASFSSYGSEKRGSPVKAYIRWCSDSIDIGINSPLSAASPFTTASCSEATGACLFVL